MEAGVCHKGLDQDKEFGVLVPGVYLSNQRKVIYLAGLKLIWANLIKEEVERNYTEGSYEKYLHVPQIDIPIELLFTRSSYSFLYWVVLKLVYEENVLFHCLNHLITN